MIAQSRLAFRAIGAHARSFVGLPTDDPHVLDPHVLDPHVLDPHVLDPHVLDVALARCVQMPRPLRRLAAKGSANRYRPASRSNASASVKKSAPPSILTADSGTSELPETLWWARRGACHRAALCAEPLAPSPALRLLYISASVSFDTRLCP
jgi:hypothetical protein